MICKFIFIYFHIYIKDVFDHLIEISEANDGLTNDNIGLNEYPKLANP